MPVQGKVETPGVPVCQTPSGRAIFRNAIQADVEMQGAINTLAPETQGATIALHFFFFGEGLGLHRQGLLLRPG